MIESLILLVPVSYTSYMFNRLWVANRFRATNSHENSTLLTGRIHSNSNFNSNSNSSKVYQEFELERLKKKWRTTYRTVIVGKQHVNIPYPEKYTDSKIVFTDRNSVKDAHINRVQVIISDTTDMSLTAKVSRKMDHKSVDCLKVINVDHAAKYIAHYREINNNDTVTVFGSTNNNNQINARIVGPDVESVKDKVVFDIIGFTKIGMSLGVLSSLGTAGFLFMA